jgi:hypothetical protein
MINIGRTAQTTDGGELYIRVGKATDGGEI